MHLYVIEHPRRDELRAFLDRHGVQAALHYPVAIHRQDAYQGRAFRGSDGLQETERLYPRILSLPMYPELTDNQVKRVISLVLEWLQGSS